MATLTFVYADSTAVVGPLALRAEPGTYDLCRAHSQGLSAPRGLGGDPPARRPQQPASLDRRPDGSGGRRPPGRAGDGPAEPVRTRGDSSEGPSGGPRRSAGRLRRHRSQDGMSDRGPHAARLRCVIQPHVFKANDIRGLVGGEAPEWDVDGARAIGAAFAAAFGLDGQEFVLGRDMRAGGRELSLAFADGARDQGASVRRRRARQHRPAVVRVRAHAPSRRPVHRVPQPGRLQRGEVLPAATPPRSRRS